MIDVKQAANIAVNYVADLLGKENVEDPRLEEVELSSDGHEWLITVGFFPSPAVLYNRGLSPLLRRPENERVYKQVQIKDDGTVTAMRIRRV